MKINLRNILLGIAVAACANAGALTLPDIVNRNMMLQQNSDAALWGWAKPGSTVKVVTGWNGKEYTSKAAKNGRWDVKVATPAASYDVQTVTITGDGESVTLDNVLVGEVWFASGQSNMEMPLRGFWGAPIEGANKAIAESGKYKHAIRFATVPKTRSEVPLDSVKGEWVECVPENAPDFSAVGYFFARELNNIIDVPVGIINCSWGGSRVEGWLPKEILEQYPDEKLDIKQLDADPSVPEYMLPMVMYNGMLHPLMGYTVRGFLWNQGESNLGHHADYPSRFATMMKHWREKWGQGEIPVYCVEVPPHYYGDEQATLGALLRESQHKAVEIVPNSGIVSTVDLVTPGTSFQIHPSKKLEIGERLAYMAAVRDYGVKGIACDSPEFVSMDVDGNKATLHFRNADDGFSPERDMEGFEVAGEDRVFYPAQAKQVYTDRCNVEVTSDKVDKIVAVRYCFKNWSPGNIYGMRELPLVPFRTDNWEK